MLKLEIEKEEGMIKYLKPTVVIMALLVCLFISKPVFSAGDIYEGMKQGDFAMLIVKELGAEGLLPAAATISDYFALLEELGCTPPDGWDEEESIIREDLVDMLGVTGEEANLSFDELLNKLETRLADVLWTMGVRTGGSQKTISPSGL